MNTPTFDLVEIVKIVQKNLKAILLITVAAGLIGAIGNRIKGKEYQAEGEVYILNPMFGDHNNLFRHVQEGVHFIDYFGSEGDVDRIMTMVASKDVEDSVIAASGLYEAYKLNPAEKKGRLAMSQRFRASFEAKRTENCSILMCYTDADPALAKKVVAALIAITDNKIRGYISSIKLNSMRVVEKKMQDLDGQIIQYTDSLVALRNKYQIFDIISPVRRGTTVSAINTAGKIDPARGIEEIQNIEAIKDQLVINRSELSATANELNSNVADEVQLLYNVTTPYLPEKATGLGLVLTTFACAAVAFFFSILLFSFTSYIRALARTER